MTAGPSAPLGQHVSLQRGTTYKSLYLGQPGPVLLGLSSIARDGGFRRDSLKTYGGDSPKKLLVHPGELYVALKDVTQSGDLLGAVACVPHSVPVGRLTQDTVKLTVTSGIRSDYLYWILRTPQYRKYCRVHAMGTTNLSLSREDFLSFSVPHPTAERIFLTEVLAALDDKIAVNDRIASTSMRIAEALADSCIQNSVRTAALGEVVRLAYGKALKATERSPGDIPVYGGNGVSGWHSSAYVKGPGIIIGRKGANAGSVSWSATDFWPIDTSFYVEPLSELPSQELIFFILKKSRLRELVGDSAIPGLNRDAALQLPIPIPPPEMSRKYSSQIRSQFSLQENTARENKCLGALRDVLLPKLMSGEIKIRDTERVVEEAI